MLTLIRRRARVSLPLGRAQRDYSRRWKPGAASMVPPLALQHVEQQLQSIALSSARAREDIDRLFDTATAPVAAPAESEDASLPGILSPRKSREPLGLHLLPEDLSAICAGYLRVVDVVTYSACSEATREWYESEEPWEGFLEPLCLRLSWWFGLEGDEDEPSARARASSRVQPAASEALPGVRATARRQRRNRRGPRDREALARCLRRIDGH